MRANVNVFYKCERLWTIGPFIRFKRTEYQDLLNESVDEDPEKVISVKYYMGKNAVFNAYDTKYLRGDISPSQRVQFKAYDIGYVSRFVLFLLTIKYAIFGGYKTQQPSSGDEGIVPVKPPPQMQDIIKTVSRQEVGITTGQRNEEVHTESNVEKKTWWQRFRSRAPDGSNTGDSTGHEPIFRPSGGTP